MEEREYYTSEYEYVGPAEITLVLLGGAGSKRHPLRLGEHVKAEMNIAKATIVAVRDGSDGKWKECRPVLVVPEYLSAVATDRLRWLDKSHLRFLAVRRHEAEENGDLYWYTGAKRMLVSMDEKPVTLARGNVVRGIDDGGKVHVLRVDGTAVWGDVALPKDGFKKIAENRAFNLI